MWIKPNNTLISSESNLFYFYYIQVFLNRIFFSYKLTYKNKYYINLSLKSAFENGFFKNLNCRRLHESQVDIFDQQLVLT